MVEPGIIAIGGSLGLGVIMRIGEHYLSKKDMKEAKAFMEKYEYKPPTRSEIMQSVLNSYNNARRIPREAMAIVARIGRLIQEIYPLLSRLGEASEEHYNYQQVALRYLPDALDMYNKLDPSWRVEEPVHEGKTAAELLIDQLLDLETLLIGIRDECNTSQSREDANALVVNAMFIKSKVKPID